MGNITFQVIHKTNCCNKTKDDYNEDLNEDVDDKDDNEDDKLISNRINSFSTDINKTVV